MTTRHVVALASAVIVGSAVAADVHYGIVNLPTEEAMTGDASLQAIRNALQVERLLALTAMLFVSDDPVKRVMRRSRTVLASLLLGGLTACSSLHSYTATANKLAAVSYQYDWKPPGSDALWSPDQTERRKADLKSCVDIRSARRR